MAAALGVVKALASGPALSHSILVLLNGAEESMFLAAHAFAGQHRWAKDYRVLLNLEAIGAGGTSVVFQMGPDADWLASAVGSSQRPRGTVTAHDLFQVPGFPAATDFKTLLAQAPVGEAEPVVGLDMATLGNGYVYHTPLDAAELIGLDELQDLLDADP